MIRRPPRSTLFPTRRSSDLVLIPVQAEYYALEGLSQLVHSVNLVKARLNPRLAIGGVLVTMVDGRTRLSAEVEDERSEEHTSELQSQSNLVCRLLLEKKKNI